jgi:HAD superfamily hydrolase (TIGR01490 family)
MKNSRSHKKTKLAIFDIDGTIFRSSLLIELFNELVRRGIFPEKASQEVEREYLAWLNRKGHYNDYLIKLVKVHYRYQAGRTEKEVEEAIGAVVAWQKDRVYRYTRDLVQKLKRQGYYLLAISNSQESMVRQFTRELSFDAAIGRVPEVTDGIYTGRTVIAGKPFPITSHIDKIKILQQFIADHGLHVDLANSIMVGDSEGDLPLLSHVGKPIAFNPSEPLARIAKRKGWQIVIERKDVVYRIKDTELIPIAERQKARIPYGKQTRS